jgi:ribosomal protein S18
MSRFKLKISSRLVKKKARKQWFQTQKQCRFCSSKEHEDMLDYKNADLLRSFLSERGKILPTRVSGNCFYHQRKLARHMKIARSMALLPYCPVHLV